MSLAAGELGPGTAEARWRAWPRLTAAPVLVPPALDRVVVVAPHPDDEVLGVGGTVQALAASGAEVVLVGVTDGGASHPGSLATSPARLRRARRREAEVAWRRLGLGGAPVTRLGLPDGGVAGAEAELAAALVQALQPPGGAAASTWCLAPWRADGHPDHDAAGRAAAVACRATGAELASYLVWTWHWAVPGDPAVPWDRLRRVPLTRVQRRRKAAAIRAHRSQVRALGPHPPDGPVLPPAVLDRFRRPFEVLLVGAP